MIAAGFAVFSACLLGCFIGLSASQDVYCLKNNSRLNASSSDKCHSQTYLCQAITEGGLYLECVNCEQLQNTTWTLPDKGLEATPKITTPNSTLYLPGNVTPGCYFCECGNSYASIEVTVNKSDLRFTYNDSDLPFVHIMVQPEGGTLSIGDPGKVNISCPTTGYPDPHYEWTYSEEPETPPNFHPISDDPCLDVSPDGQHLIFSVCPLNSGKRNKRTYKCSITNGVSDISSQKSDVMIRATNWILHTHPLQTVGPISLLDGVANGTVAAYNDWWDDDSQLSINYEICRIPDHLNSTAASMPSCSYKQLDCCPCDSNSSTDNCSFNLTSYITDPAVDPAGMYEPTMACHFQVREEMKIAMFATRCYSDGTCEDRVRQLMGISEVRTIISPLPTTHSDTNLYIAAGVGPGGFLLGILVAVLCCVVAINVYKKLNQGRYQRLGEDVGNPNPNPNPNPRNGGLPRDEGVPGDLEVGGGDGNPDVEGSQNSTSRPSSTPNVDRCFELGDRFGEICVRLTHDKEKIKVGIGHHTNEGFSEEHHFVSSGEEDFFRVQVRKSETNSGT